MKKTLFISVIALLLIVSGANASLWDFYQDRGEVLPSVSERLLDAQNCGIEGYTGTYDQNIELEQCLGNTSVFGATPKRPTEFKSNLAQQFTEGHSGTTLKVTSLTTKDGNTLSASVLGDFIVLSINSGASNSEVVACTGLTVSTKTFTGCTFGYRFDDPSLTQAGNIKAHAPGEPVIISNTDTYLTQQYPTIDGNNIFIGTNTISTTTDGISFMQLFFGGSNVYIWANTSTPAIGWSTDGGTEFTFNDNGTSFSTGPSMKLSSGFLDVNTSTALFFDINDQGFFVIATSTGSMIDINWDDKLNATTTKEQWIIASSTILGNFLVEGNATTTASLVATGELRIGTRSVASYFAPMAQDSHTGTTVETGIATTSLAANDMDANSRLMFDAYGSHAFGTGSQITLSLQLGGVEIASSTHSGNGASALLTKNWDVSCNIINTATNVQTTGCVWNFQADDDVTELGHPTTTNMITTVDMTSAQDLKLFTTLQTGTNVTFFTGGQVGLIQ